MQDARVGAIFRAVRVRKGWRQQDVADRAHVSRATVSLMERGNLDGMPLRFLRRVGAVLEIQVELLGRWRGADVDRLLNAGHAQLHEEVASYFDSLPGWVHRPEVSFSIWGERGVIDILAFHEPTGSLLVIELKTELASIEDLLTTMDRRMRLALQIAAKLGWKARTISGWVLIAEGDANRSRARKHAATLRAAFPDDGHAMRSWLRHPSGTIAALSFWGNAAGRSTTKRLATPQRVRRPTVRPAA